MYDCLCLFVKWHVCVCFVYCALNPVSTPTNESVNVLYKCLVQQEPKDNLCRLLVSSFCKNNDSLCLMAASSQEVFLKALLLQCFSWVLFNP